MENNTSMRLEEPDHSSANWYFSKEEIEQNSPSRKDGIDLRKETYLRKSFCTYLQDLGMRLKLPQYTIATAIVFCHRFFLRQSHHKNDRFMIATICMFIAGKAEDSPRSLRDVILVSFDIRFKKDPAAVHRIKQLEVYEAEKERVLLGERLVLTTLVFDLNIQHPYKPLAAAVAKFNSTLDLGVHNPQLAQVAWNFLNDGLRTSLCLQYKPHHIAAGALFLAAKFLKVKLPSEGDNIWWKVFEINPRQLEDVSNQMLNLYEQGKSGNSSMMSDPSLGAGPNNQVKLMSAFEVLPQPKRYSKSAAEKTYIMETVKRVEVEGADITEARSSLEEVEDIVESRPAPTQWQATHKIMRIEGGIMFKT